MFFVLAILTLFLYSCEDEYVVKINKIYFCDVENINDFLKTIYDSTDTNVAFNVYNIKTQGDAYYGVNYLKLT